MAKLGGHITMYVATPRAIWFSALLLGLLFWIVSWNIAAKMDRTVCAAYGAEYAGTSLMFDGYCRVSGIEVKAESLSWKN